MKKLPEVDLSFEHLYRMLIAPIRSKLLLAGIELKVFNQLSEPRSAEDVAEAIGTHPENTRLFMDGLAAIELLTKRNGLYQNISVTQTFLVEGTPTYLGQSFTFWNQMLNPALNPGGVFISFHDGLTHERTKPETMVLAWLPTAVMGNDFGLDQGFIADSMLRVGFKSVRSRTLDTLMGPMDLDIGRKAKKVRNQKSEVRNQKSEIRNQRSEVRGSVEFFLTSDI